MTTHVFLSPGMFGFESLASFEYFAHFADGVRRRLVARGHAPRIHVVDVHPTASIRRRAHKLHDAMVAIEDDPGDIHLVGHSTGGLDARLVVSPSVTLPGPKGPDDVVRRVRSVTTINTPHFGTPLASFFATVSGQRMLYAVSALTVTALKLGAPPLTLASSLVAAFGRIDKAVGIELALVEKLTDGVVRTLDDASSRELRDYLRALRDDQGAIVQLTPESMDLFEAGVENAPDVRYQCVVTYAPEPGAVSWARSMLKPWDSLSFPIFATLHRLTGLESPTYPCRSSDPTVETRLLAALGASGDKSVPPLSASDGVVPLRSQVWGDVVWAGKGDHLDVVGHFAAHESDSARHVDWLCSRAGFTRGRFDTMLDRVVEGMLAT